MQITALYQSFLVNHLLEDKSKIDQAIQKETSLIERIFLMLINKMDLNVLFWGNNIVFFR